MKLKIYTTLLIAGSLFLNACQKDIDIFVPDPGQINGPDTAWYSTITASMPVFALKNSLALNTHHDSIMVTANISTIATLSGLICIFPPNSCVSTTGQNVTGKVDVELQLLKKKGDMIRMGRPTTSNGRLLVSAGEIFMNLKKEGQPVQLAPGKKVEIKLADLPINQNMEFFVGDETNTQHFNWLTNTDTANKVIPGTQFYEIWTTRLRWINCASFQDTTGGRTAITAILPSHYTNANTIVYIALKDQRSVISVPGDLSTRKFNSIRLPNGKLAHVVAISKQGYDYFMGTALINIGNPGPTPPNNQLVTLHPVKTTLDAVKNFLDGL